MPWNPNCYGIVCKNFFFRKSTGRHDNRIINSFYWRYNISIVGWRGHVENKSDESSAHEAAQTKFFFSFFFFDQFGLFTELFSCAYDIRNYLVSSKIMFFGTSVLWRCVVKAWLLNIIDVYLPLNLTRRWDKIVAPRSFGTHSIASRWIVESISETVTLGGPTL